MLNHALTPGTGGYAVLKMGAVAGVFGLRFAVSRRSRRKAAEEHAVVSDAAPGSEQPTPHPVSRKKQQARRRR